MHLVTHTVTNTHTHTHTHTNTQTHTHTHTHTHTKGQVAQGPGSPRAKIHFFSLKKNTDAKFASKLYGFGFTV
jgi:carbohydrate-binding DOMON domain-containing protein